MPLNSNYQLNSRDIRTLPNGSEWPRLDQHHNEGGQNKVQETGDFPGDTLTRQTEIRAKFGTSLVCD